VLFSTMQGLTMVCPSAGQDHTHTQTHTHTAEVGGKDYTQHKLWTQHNFRAHKHAGAQARMGHKHTHTQQQRLGAGAAMQAAGLSGSVSGHRKFRC